MLFIRKKHISLSKSSLITLISVIENYASSMMIVVLPLYLFEVFRSELLVGQIYTSSSLLGVLLMLVLGFLLSHFSRAILYKIGVVIGMISIFLFLLLSSTAEAYLGRGLYVISTTLTPVILSLYLRDLTSEKELPHMQGVYSALQNLAWLTGPMLAGFMIGFFDNNTHISSTFPLLEYLHPEYFAYHATLLLSLGLYAGAVFLFIWNKFVVSHPHLQDSHTSHHTNARYMQSFIAHIVEHFDHPKRAISFANVTFIAIWWVFIFAYFGILLEQHGVSPVHIGIFLGCISLPNTLFEAFVDKIVLWCKGSTNALIFGYGVFYFFVLMAFFVGMDNIYFFAILIVISQIGVAITEPLEMLQYFEGTDKDNEDRFYAIHEFGGHFFSLLIPLLLGVCITTIGIDKTFYILPFLFPPFFVLLWYLRKKDIAYNAARKKEQSGIEKISKT